MNATLHASSVNQARKPWDNLETSRTTYLQLQTTGKCRSRSTAHHVLVTWLFIIGFHMKKCPWFSGGSRRSGKSSVGDCVLEIHASRARNLARRCFQTAGALPVWGDRFSRNRRSCNRVPTAPSLQHSPCRTIPAVLSLLHSPCSAVPAASSLQRCPCSAVLAVLSLQCRPCSAVPAAPSLQHRPCSTKSAAPSLHSTILAARQMGCEALCVIGYQDQL